MLTLTQIKSTNKVDQVNLVLSDNQIIPFPVDRLHQFCLSKGLEVTPELYSKLISASLAFVLYNYSLRLIAMSPQTEATVSTKLLVYIKRYLQKYSLTQSRENIQNLINQVIDKLKEHNLLSDADYAKFLISKFKNKSQREIIFRLQRAGVSPESYPEELANDRDETGIIRNLAAKKLKNNSDLTDPKVKNKVMSYLVRKGFAFDTVKTVIDEMLANR